MAEPAEYHRELQAAVEQTLQSSLEGITRQLDELVAAVSAVSQHASGGSASSSFLSAIQPLVQAQAKAAAVTASLDVLSRFLSLSIQMTAVPIVAAPAAAPRAAAPAVEEVEEAPAAVYAAPPPPPPAPAAAPAVAAKPVFDVSTLPHEKQELHKKARRFARVSVQEMSMYKPKEVELGRKNKDLYQRFQEEIDKGRATYEKRFAEIADSHVDYFYEELVHSLANNDPDALGNYPYAIPSVRVS